MVRKLHDGEVDIDAALVGRLLAAQFPRWADRSIDVVESSGTDNVTFRLGGDLAVRLPRMSWGAGQVELDREWLPRLAPHFSVGIPQLLAVGVAGEGYPYGWGVYRWLDGEPLRVGRLGDPVGLAVELAGFVRSLREIDAAGAPTPSDDPFSRGTPLGPRDGLFREALDQLRDEFDMPLVLSAWEASLAAAAGWGGPPALIHGDLLPGNLLVAEGRLAAVIDFATLRAADPAGDLLPAWCIFSGESRRVFRAELGVDDDTWARGRGWALSMALIAMPYYRTRRPDGGGEAPRVIAETLADFALDG